MITGRDFFVTYADKDTQWAEWIAWTLEEAGWHVWLAKWDFTGNFVAQMDTAHSQSDCTIAVLSKAATASGHVQSEWNARRASDPLLERRSLLLLKVEAWEEPPLLKAAIHLDFTNYSTEGTAKQSLINWVTAQSALEKRTVSLPTATRLKPTQCPVFPGGGSPERTSTRASLVHNLPPFNLHFFGRASDLKQLAIELTAQTKK